MWRQSTRRRCSNQSYWYLNWVKSVLRLVLSFQELPNDQMNNVLTANQLLWCSPVRTWINQPQLKKKWTLTRSPSVLTFWDACCALSVVQDWQKWLYVAGISKRYALFLWCQTSVTHSLSLHPGPVSCSCGWDRMGQGDMRGERFSSEKNFVFLCC